MSDLDYTRLHSSLNQVESTIKAFEELIDNTPDEMECWNVVHSLTEVLRFKFDHLRRQMIHRSPVQG